MKKLLVCGLALAAMFLSTNGWAGGSSSPPCTGDFCGKTTAQARTELGVTEYESRPADGAILKYYRGATQAVDLIKEAVAGTDYVAPESVTSGGTCSTTYTPATNSGVYTLTLNGACAIANPTTITAARSFTVKLTQSSTTAPTFGTAYKWASGTAPTWSTSATKYDMFSCVSFDGSTLQCSGVVDVR